MEELIKAARAFGWGIGLMTLFVQPVAGLAILLVALVATIHLAGQQNNEGSNSGDEAR